MSAPETSAAWDFTHVIDLLHSFKLDASQKPGEALRDAQPKPLQTVNNDTITIPPGGPQCRNGDSGKLGDFSSLWDFLSQSDPPASDAAARSAPPSQPALVANGKPRNDLEEALEATVERHTRPEGTQAKKIILKRRDTPANVGSPLNDAGLSTPARPSIQILKNSDTSRVQQLAPTPQVVPKLNGHTASDSAIGPPPTLPKTLSKSLLKNRFQVEAKLTGSAAERKAGLIKLLRTSHKEQKQYLSNPKLCDPNYVSSNISPNGIHVFVDTSNVMVGFHDCVKTARDIPTTIRVPRLPLSFHNFSLILERGRPVNKRVLAGSDRFPAIDEAEMLGYETNILVRVQKVKEASPRKKNVLNGRDTPSSKRNGNKQRDQSSGSDTNPKPIIPEKWMEQAVDEILHLKMLESIVDTDQPSTIVLVTGDAAEAEYSDGFLKMVERALHKGWTVELVSFSCTISRAYYRKEFRSKWGSKFSIIELDRYAEHLLDM